MADGLAVSPGAGATVATDEIGGHHYQRIKLTVGPDGSATDVSESKPLPVGLLIANPSANFALPGSAITVDANDIVANSTAAGSISYGALQVAREAAGSFRIDRLRLYSNHTTGLAGINVRVRLWTAAPTYANGHGGAYSVTAGHAGYLGSFTGVFEQFADGAVAILTCDYGPGGVKCDLASGQSVFWDLQTLTSFPQQASKTVTLVAEVDQN